MSQKGDGRRGKAVKKFNVAAAEFDPTSVSAAVAGFVPGAVQPGSPAMKPAGSPALAAMAATGAIPGIYGSMGMAGVAGGASGAVAPQETRVIFRSVPKEVDTVALIKNCEMSLGHVVGCDFSSSTGLGVVTFQLPASAAMAVQCSGMPVFPGMPPFHISLADHAALDTPCSNTLVVKGLPHHASRSDALRAVCAVRPLPSAMELHLRERGEVWARYEDLDAAAEAALALSGSTPPEAEAEGGSGALEVAYKRGDPAHLSEKNLISYNEEGVPVQTLHRPGAGGEGGRRGGAREAGEASRGGRRAFGAGHAAGRTRTDSMDSTASSASHASWRWEGGAKAPAPAGATPTRRRSRGSSVGSEGGGGGGGDLDWGAFRRGDAPSATKPSKGGKGGKGRTRRASEDGEGSRSGGKSGNRSRGQSESAAVAVPAQGGPPPAELFMSALVAGAKDSGEGQ